MKIHVKCKCGAEAEWPSGEFINKGGHKDEHGRVFVVELRAAEWYAMHAGCLPQHVTVNAKWMERT